MARGVKPGRVIQHPKQQRYRDSITTICAVGGCGSVAKAKRPGSICHKHYDRMRRHGSLDTVIPPRSGTDHPGWVGDRVTYFGAHRRVRRVHGNATSHLCEMGCGRQAREWAYKHGCPREKVDANTGMPYSPDVDSYQPMCNSCHEALDTEHNPGRNKRYASTA